MRERTATAKLIVLLAEFDRRRLYLAEGYSSLFVFCTNALHLSESSAYDRIQAARAARKWPAILEHLRAGVITLGALGTLAPHLTDANCKGLLEEARHKSKRDVERIVARIRPRPDVPSVIRKLPAVPVAMWSATPASQSHTDPTPMHPDLPSAQPVLPSGPPVLPSAHAGLTSGQPVPPSGQADAVPALLAALPPPRPAVIAALTPERYKIQVTVDRETYDLLREAQDLMRHSVPNGDPAMILSRALRSLVDTLLRNKAAITTRMARPRSVAEGSRTIPAHVRREVWRRDKGQCAFVGPRGRCEGHAFIEYHHVIPYARGGTASVDNIELRCRAHNSHEAQLAGLAREEQARASPRQARGTGAGVA
ncbi:MAG: HNH endonuclease [Acidobacteriota bacterium]|nr:HNH endonuclease [Acidobacteriota bacterium]